MDFEPSAIQRENSAVIRTDVAERFAGHETSTDPELERLAWHDAAKST
jgi:hypothetical protein